MFCPDPNHIHRSSTRLLFAVISSFHSSVRELPWAPHELLLRVSGAVLKLKASLENWGTSQSHGHLRCSFFVLSSRLFVWFGYLLGNLFVMFSLMVSPAVLFFEVETWVRKTTTTWGPSCQSARRVEPSCHLEALTLHHIDAGLQRLRKLRADFQTDLVAEKVYLQKPNGFT